MILSNEQAKEFQDEAIEFLTEHEYEHVTVDIDDTYNIVHIFDRLPIHPDEVEITGKEVLELKDRAQFILHNEI